jgi:hypothetical protein
LRVDQHPVTGLDPNHPQAVPGGGVCSVTAAAWSSCSWAESVTEVSVTGDEGGPAAVLEAADTVAAVVIYIGPDRGHHAAKSTQPQVTSVEAGVSAHTGENIGEVEGWTR